MSLEMVGFYQTSKNKLHSTVQWIVVLTFKYSIFEIIIFFKSAFKKHFIGFTVIEQHLRQWKIEYSLRFTSDVTGAQKQDWTVTKVNNLIIDDIYWLKVY